ncbi:MAG: response regulator [Frankiales bacterium]|nr:response regulator [Frankiales bacterium]
MRPDQAALVIDDADDIRLLLRAVLEAAGWAVCEAATGVDVRGTLEASTPSVVLLDVQMPDRDGWATLADIRSHPTLGDVPVILCTVKSTTADRARGWQLGADGYISKPFALDDVIAEVADVASRPTELRSAVRAARLKELQELEETRS